MIEDFLSTIWGERPDYDTDWYGELRILSPDFPPEQEWAFIESHSWFADTAKRRSGNADVYYGVLPRIRKEGTTGACVPTTHVLWADVDAKRTGGKWAALAGIRMAKQQPSIIVDSGHGYHCYWLLTEEVPFEQAQAAMKALAREVHGDAVYDAARILRVPGTTNRKDPENPVPVRLIYWDVERKYRISDFDRVFPAAERGIVYSRTGHCQADELPEWLQALVIEETPRGGRSEASFKVVLWLVRYGWDDTEIDTLFSTHEDGIGEKYHELKAQGPRWLRRTIKAARAAA